MTYVIALPCVDLKDRACIDECPVDCIYEGDRMLYIHPDECVDCGACEPVCPVEAIYYEDDLPDQWADYYKANVEFFDEIGSPGGAAKVGVIASDHPVVAALPPQGALSRRGRSSSPTSPGTRSSRTRMRRARIPDGIVDLSVGSPVDPTPALVRDALAAATDAHAYPQTAGTPALREAIVDWYARRRGVADLTVANVIPTIGSKEFVACCRRCSAWAGRRRRAAARRLPDLRGRRGASSARPCSSSRRARTSGRTRRGSSGSTARATPTAACTESSSCARAVARARELGAVIANDECYAELDWTEPTSRRPASSTRA